MCGIAGVIHRKKLTMIQKMTDSLIHRGPDDSDFYHDDYISLGHRRLSINDLENGRQPISNKDDTVFLICNGEIYNSPTLRKELQSRGYQFKTHSDVEVILHLYEEHGKDCVKHLQGMFAFAIWDTKNQKLLLARDHLGQKPLFFCQTESGFAFASEIKALIASDFIKPEIDLNGLWHYVSLRYLPENFSLFQGIAQLPAATILEFSKGNIRQEKYWSLSFTEKLPHNEKEIEEGLHDLLLNTVKDHLLSDVPVGAFLSGGIDSGTVASMMATMSENPISTFSLGTKESSFNELPYSRMVAEKYGMKPYEQVVGVDLIQSIPEMVYHMDEPSDPFGFGVFLVSKLAKGKVKVVLGGDGGDENFAGYDRFLGQRLVDYYCLFPKWFRKNIIERVTSRIPETNAYKSFAQKFNWLNEMSRYEGGERYAHSFGVLRFTREAKESLFTENARKSIDDYHSFDKILNYFDADNADHLIDKMLYTDLMTRIPGHILPLSDRMTMAHSIEMRSPLIDYKIVEYAAKIPANLKIKGNNLKHILRKVSSRYLPKEIITLPKQGFGFPIGIWMKTELKTFLRNLIDDSRFVQKGIFNQKYVSNIVEEHISGKMDHSYRLWILINLEIWYRIFFEGESIESMKQTIKELSQTPTSFQP